MTTSTTAPNIGRLGAAAALALRGHKAGVMADRRLHRKHTRAVMQRAAIRESLA